MNLKIINFSINFRGNPLESSKLEKKFTIFGKYRNIKYKY